MGPHRTLHVLGAVLGLASLAAAQLGLPQELVNFSEAPCGAGLADLARSVASIGDVDGDGLPDIVLGCPTTPTAAGMNVGRVLVLSAADRSVLFSLDGDAAGDFLGNSVDGAGDVDGDGTPDLVVGVPHFGAPEGVSGEVRVLSGADGSLRLTLHIHGEDMALGDSVSGGADIDGDGHPDIVALASGKEYYESGVVSAHSGADGSELHDFPVASTFGLFLADTFGDLDHDGSDEMLIGIIAEGPAWLGVRSGADGHVMHSFFDEGWAHDAGDHDGDGTEDLLFDSGQLLSGRDWQTLVEFQGSGTSARLGDVDGDGLSDYALGDGVYSGSGGPAVFTASKTLKLAPAGDVDGDGGLDLLGVVSGSDPPSPAWPLFRLLLNRPALQLETLPGPPVPDKFERVLASAGDVDGDGHPDLVAGLRPTKSLAGAHPVQVLSGETGATLLEIPSPPGTIDFGAAVAGAGDVDGDGALDLVVGAPGQVLGTSMTGAAWVFSGADGHALVSHADSSAGAAFGRAVAGVGDVDGDGFADVFVGAPGGAGAAYVLAGPDGTQLFKAPGSTFPMQLGAAAAAAGDADGDGHVDLFVGAPNTSIGGSPVGAVLLLSGHDGSVLKTFGGTDPAHLFGTSLARLGDIDHDGLQDFASAWAVSKFIGYAAGCSGAFSGATGTPLFAWEQVTFEAKTTDVVPALAAGDVDGDGTLDVLVGTRTSGDEGLLEVHSGADGGVLLTAAGQANEQLGASVLALDADGDGRQDALVDVPGAGAGGAFRAYALPALAAPWTYAGHGLLGTHGLPQLVGAGTWRPDELVSVQLGNALSLAPTVLVVGLEAGLLAFKGGTLVPAPQLVLSAPVTDAAGGWTLEAHAPAVVPPPLVLQVWIADAAASHGFAASNALLVEPD
jgi:hypothetical protein